MHLAWRLGYRETREPALQPRFRYGWARYGCSAVGRNAPRLAARLSRNARACTATSFPLCFNSVWVFHPIKSKRNAPRLAARLSRNAIYIKKETTTFK